MIVDLGFVGRWASYALALLLPLAVRWPVGRSFGLGIADVYARSGLYLSDVAVVALLLGGLARGRLFRGAAEEGHVASLLAALVALGLLSVPTASSPILASYTALRWFVALGVCLILARSEVTIGRWVTVLVIGFGVQSCLGIAQVAAQGRLGMPGEATLAPHQIGAAVLSVGGRPWLRAYGLTFHPNVMGGCLAIGLLVSLPLLDRRWMRALWWVLGLGLLVSFSRSAWLATGLILPPLAGWLAWRRPKLRRPLAVTLGGAALILVVVVGVLSGQLVSRLRPRATATEFRSLYERGELIGLALDLAADRPLTGVGAGNFAMAAQNTDRPVHPQPVHNVPLLIASEVGLVGGGIWLWLWLAPGLAVAERLEGGSLWPVVLAAAWFALGVIGLWDSYPWALNSGRLLGASLLGLMNRAWQASPGTIK